MFHHGSLEWKNKIASWGESWHRVLITAYVKNQKGQVELTFLVLTHLRSVGLCVRRTTAVLGLHPATCSGLMVSAGSPRAVQCSEQCQNTLPITEVLHCTLDLHWLSSRTLNLTQLTHTEYVKLFRKSTLLMCAFKRPSSGFLINDLPSVHQLPSTHLQTDQLRVCESSSILPKSCI